MGEGIVGPMRNGPEGVQEGVAKVLDNEIKPYSLRQLGVPLDD